MTTAQQAKETANKIGVKQIWANDSGEFFTTENNALVSVNNNSSKVTKFDFATDEEGEPSVPNGGLPVKYKLTAGDIKKFPAFKEAGLKAGDDLNFNPKDDIAPEQLKQLLGLSQQ